VAGSDSDQEAGASAPADQNPISFHASFGTVLSPPMQLE
jgi:hypothetical protein